MPNAGSASAISINRQVSTTHAITHALPREVPPSSQPCSEVPPEIAERSPASRLHRPVAGPEQPSVPDLATTSATRGRAFRLVVLLSRSPFRLRSREQGNTRKKSGKLSFP